MSRCLGMEVVPLTLLTLRMDFYAPQRADCDVCVKKLQYRNNGRLLLESVGFWNLRRRIFGSNQPADHQLL